MRKLLYIPYNQDGFLPSCFSLFPAQVPDPCIIYWFTVNNATAFILYHSFFLKTSFFCKIYRSDATFFSGFLFGERIATTILSRPARSRSPVI